MQLTKSLRVLHTDHFTASLKPARQGGALRGGAGEEVIFGSEFLVTCPGLPNV